MQDDYLYGYGQEVRIVDSAPEGMCPGQRGSVCGMRKENARALYLIECSDGCAMEISEEFILG